MKQAVGKANLANTQGALAPAACAYEGVEVPLPGRRGFPSSHGSRRANSCLTTS